MGNGDDISHIFCVFPLLFHRQFLFTCYTYLTTVYLVFNFTQAT